MTPTTTSMSLTATEKKLCKSDSPTGTDNKATSSESKLDIDGVYEKSGSRVLEVSGILCALQELSCKLCGVGPLKFKENVSHSNGLYANPYMFL